MMHDEQALVLRQDEAGVATLTLNRPQVRNALSRDMLRALRAVFADLADDGDVHVVILAGAGPAFCAGHDLKEMRAEGYGADYAESLFADCAALMLDIVRLPKPVIAQVHGIATAAGCQLVATCDLAIAAEDARFATPGVNIGLFCSTPMVALSRNLGTKQAMQLLLTGEAIDAPTALGFGLINEVVAPAELAARTAALARQVASKSPLTLAIGKEAFYRQLPLSIAEAYDYTREVMVRNLAALDAQEGIDALLEKRQPSWCGR